MKNNMKLIMENWRKHKKLLTEESVWDAWYTKDDVDIEVDDEGVETYPEQPDNFPALYQARTKKRAEAIIQAMIHDGLDLKELSSRAKTVAGERELFDYVQDLADDLKNVERRTAPPGFPPGTTPVEEVYDAADKAVDMIIAGDVDVPQEQQNQLSKGL